MSWVFTANTHSDLPDRQLKLTITETLNPTGNSSVLSWVFSSEGSSGHYYTVDETTIKINGTTVYSKPKTTGTSHSFPAAVGSVTGSIEVPHNASGAATNIPIVFMTHIGSVSPIPDYGGSIDLTTISTYSLSISAGTHSSIAVRRTSSGGGSTGYLSNGAPLYSGDILIISFAADEGYEVDIHTVNTEPFVSGASYIVSGNVAVFSSAQYMGSSIGATDANIGSVSTITITKQSSFYATSVSYSIGSLSGFITENGGTSNTEVPFRKNSVAFTIPSSFYGELGNDDHATCTLTMRTYQSIVSSTQVGEPVICRFTVYVVPSQLVPTICGTVKDTNSVTKMLTGDDSKLIKYKSTATCAIDVVPKYSATVSLASINDSSVVVSLSNGHYIGTKVISNVADSSFAFAATDSRGYSASTIVAPTIVPYINLSCNPTIKRPSPTSTRMTLSFNGNCFGGSFGAYSNAITVKYRYRERGSNYSSWVVVSSSNYTVQATSYYTPSAITLVETFSYQKSYDFQVQVSDGANGEILSTVTTTISVARGLPVFDWGEDDFNINGALKLSGIDILDIIYPVGSVFITNTNAMPRLFSIHTWTWGPVAGNGGVTDVFLWERLT